MKNSKQQLVDKYLLDQTTSSQTEEVLDWIKTTEGEAYFLRKMDEDLEQIDQEKENGSGKVISLSKQQETSNQPLIIIKSKKNFGRKWWINIAASISILALVAFAVQFFKANNSNETIAVETIIKTNPKGQKSTIYLPDGSVVKLNAESSLEFPSKFLENKRVIKLTGEAFFEVKKDSLRPFSVITGNILTTALGTSFNINAFDLSNKLEVALATGKVKVNTLNPSRENEVTLIPGEMATYAGNTDELVKKKFDLEVILGWKDGIIRFHNANFSQVKEKLERWFGVEISSQNSVEKHWEITGVFNNKSLENILDNMSYSRGFKYKIQDKKVLLY